MEVLLFTLFFVGALIFFIAGKDDFGRTESKLIIKDEANINPEDMVSKEEKNEDKLKVENMVTKEEKKEDKIAKERNTEPQKELKKES